MFLCFTTYIDQLKNEQFTLLITKIVNDLIINIYDIKIYFRKTRSYYYYYLTFHEPVKYRKYSSTL